MAAARATPATPSPPRRQRRARTAPPLCVCARCRVCRCGCLAPLTPAAARYLFQSRGADGTVVCEQEDGDSVPWCAEKVLDSRVSPRGSLLTVDNLEHDVCVPPSRPTPPSLPPTAASASPGARLPPRSHWQRRETRAGGAGSWSVAASAWYLTLRRRCASRITCAARPCHTVCFAWGGSWEFRIKESGFRTELYCFARRPPWYHGTKSRKRLRRQSFAVASSCFCHASWYKIRGYLGLAPKQTCSSFAAARPGVCTLRTPSTPT